ncbi:hypothetical protein MGU_11489 [Metarhizium guizhouense ARSEF 977]|uniref:Uncharacterized protein n=1 Tax=Metarhizium guizhouense (strain ARSEF 977) TaxID=1276136 RepID=A0A0B4GN46_METGA|nr:hypothetical protein MGU_11489 [Metarhizium guizhouense ARSEF 977]
MLQTPKKPGRPRKYATKAEKARRDVIARRERRRLQKSSAAQSRRQFIMYTAPKTQNTTLSPSSVNQTRSLCLDRLHHLADAASTLAPFTTAPDRSSDSARIASESSATSIAPGLGNTEVPAANLVTLYVSPYDPRSPPNEESSPNMESRIEASCPLEESLKKQQHSASTLNELVQCGDSLDVAHGDDSEDDSIEIHSSSGSLAGRTATVGAVHDDDDMETVHTIPSDPLNESSDLNPDGLSNDYSARENHDDYTIIANAQGGSDEGNFDVEFTPEEDFETDTVSESESEVGGQYDCEIEDDQADTVEANRLAKAFLESTWSRLCDCEEGEQHLRSHDPEARSLKEMARYWQDLGVPDAVGPLRLGQIGAEPGHDTHLDWCQILSGGERRPCLCFEKSQHTIHRLQRTWDVDSIICYSLCLSINRGLYVSYFPQVSRNIHSSVHVYHQGKPLHSIPHLRLGSGRQSPQFGVYVFFPGITHANRTTSYLTNDERRLWIDKLLLPAIRSLCPLDVIQHHPRSYDDAESKAHSRRREACSGAMRHDIDMHHYLPQEYLEPIWRHIVIASGSASPDLTMFRDMFIILSAKNIKLEARSSTFQGCRNNTIAHLRKVLDWSKADLSNTWIDVGLEDTAVSAGETLIWKSRCLQSWISSIKHDVRSPRIASEVFNWNLTDQAGSARVETRLSHPLRSGGIAYAQRYNVNKDLFATVAKRDHDLFSEPHLEGMACPPSLLDAWIVAARQGRNAGAATTARSKPQIKRLRKAFEAMKHRISHALSSSTGTSFGAREEYRISWELFIKLDPSSAQQCGNHQPFWTLSTADVNKFMQWEFNRWISAIDFVRERGSRSNCSWEDHQRNMVLVTILLRSLKASVNCHHVARRSQMFKDKYKNRKGKSLRGLGFERSMRQSGLAWLPYELFDWSALHLRDELVTSTTFTFNGLQGKFWNWKNVESVNRQYGIARELEGLLQRSEPGDRAQILDRMRKMVYQHLALQVIGQLGVKPDISDEHVAILQGHHGLSFDIAHALVGEIPYLSARARGGKHGLGGTYPARVQTLFNWDDGITRTFWDHCFYRQLARRFYGSISTVIGLTDANEWRSTLGSRSLPYFWIIPHYDKHSLFIRNKNQGP